MNELVKTEPNTALDIPFDDLEKDAGIGGKVSLRDISVPYLYILQGLSPQVQPASPKFIRGAGVSMLYLTVFDELYEGDKGLDIVPCYYERVINEWTPRAKGGGLITTHNPESDILSKAKATDPNKPAELYLPNGNLVVETAYHYILTARPNKGLQQTVFPLKSTALKHSRKWNSNISTMLIPNSAKQAPRFLFKWKLTSMAETKLDNIWYSPSFKLGEMVDKETYYMAREYAKMAATGMLRRPMEEFEQASDEHGGVEVM